MPKELSELTLEELWLLFPIILKPHNPDYKNWYVIESETIKRHLPPQIIARINHIGSSAIPGLMAKPTVDILLELNQGTDVDALMRMLQEAGWILMSSQREPDLNLVFNKGYTKYGFAEKVFHLHVRFTGNWKELYFRDYLLDHPDIAAAYGALKLSLIETFRHNRDGYTEAKTSFINLHTETAMQHYAGRYEV